MKPENTKPGETYAGLILGKVDYHLVLLPEELSRALNWDDAMVWAKSVGGDLPTSREQSLLIANCKEEFEPRWYWSNEQGSNDPEYAWIQDFYRGDQSALLKSGEYKVRAVRRIYIES